MRICPSAVSRMREHWPQNISVTGAMIPISPGAPSAKRYFHAVLAAARRVRQLQRKDTIDRFIYLASRHNHFAVPFVARIKRHKFDKPHADACLACKAGEIDNLVVVAAANDNGVDLYRIESGGLGRIDRRKHFMERIDPVIS